jgi:5-methylcytosine-specific restriction endonuclease McrA
VKTKARKQRWDAENPLARTVYKLRRRARGGDELSTKTIDSIIVEQCGICPGCRLPLDGRFHIDHIIPISKGGTSARQNLQALHARCNLVKGTKLPDVWIRETTLGAPQ